MSWSWRLHYTDGIDIWRSRAKGLKKLIGQSVYLGSETKAGKVIAYGYLHDNDHEEIDMKHANPWDHMYVTVKYPNGKFRSERLRRWKSIDIRIKEAEQSLKYLNPIREQVRKIKV